MLLLHTMAAGSVSLHWTLTMSQTAHSTLAKSDRFRARVKANRSKKDTPKKNNNVDSTRNMFGLNNVLSITVRHCNGIWNRKRTDGTLFEKFENKREMHGTWTASERKDEKKKKKKKRARAHTEEKFDIWNMCSLHAIIILHSFSKWLHFRRTDHAKIVLVHANMDWIWNRRRRRRRVLQLFIAFRHEFVFLIHSFRCRFGRCFFFFFLNSSFLWTVFFRFSLRCVWVNACHCVRSFVSQFGSSSVRIILDLSSRKNVFSGSAATAARQ